MRGREREKERTKERKKRETEGKRGPSAGAREKERKVEIMMTQENESNRGHTGFSFALIPYFFVAGEKHLLAFYAMIRGVEEKVDAKRVKEDFLGSRDLMRTFE